MKRPSHAKLAAAGHAKTSCQSYVKRRTAHGDVPRAPGRGLPVCTLPWVGQRVSVRVRAVVLTAGVDVWDAMLEDEGLL